MGEDYEKQTNSHCFSRLNEVNRIYKIVFAEEILKSLLYLQKILKD